MEPEYDLAGLVERARGGDRTAFEQLAARESPRLEAFIRKSLGKALGSAVEVEDILQEALLRAFRTLDTFQPRGPDSLFRWLCGIAENVILEAASGRRRGPAISLDFEVAADEPSLSRAARREERFDRLQAAVDSLSPDQRRVILLVRVEGLSVKEAAGRMERTPHAVSNLLLRATRRLREILGDTESLGLPDRRLERGEGTRDARAE